MFHRRVSVHGRGGGLDRPHASVPLPPGHGTWIPYPLPHHSGGHHWRLVQTCLVNLRTYPGADPGFPIGGGANPRGGGAPTYDFAKISQKLHEIEKMLGRREVLP